MRKISGIFAAVTLSDQHSPATKAVPYFSATGPTAEQTALWAPPVTAATSSLEASRSKAATPFSGTPEVSSTINSTFLPNRPPAALISATAIFIPSRRDSPVCTPPGGDSGAIPPILMVSCAPAGAAAKAATIASVDSHVDFILEPFSAALLLSASCGFAPVSPPRGGDAGPQIGRASCRE